MHAPDTAHRLAGKARVARVLFPDILSQDTVAAHFAMEQRRSMGGYVFMVPNGGLRARYSGERAVRADT